VADKPGYMTAPRSVVPGRLCFVTARAVCRMFRFVPVAEVVRVFEYLFAVAAARYRMDVHAGLRGSWAKTETPIAWRRSRSAKDLREGTFGVLRFYLQGSRPSRPG